MDFSENFEKGESKVRNTRHAKRDEASPTEKTGQLRRNIVQLRRNRDLCLRIENILFRCVPFYHYQCSARCGVGKQKRKVSCIHRLTEKPGSNCNSAAKPAQARTCKIKDCKSSGECFG